MIKRMTSIIEYVWLQICLTIKLFPAASAYLELFRLTQPKVLWFCCNVSNWLHFSLFVAG